MQLKITNTELFLSFLGSILKIVPSCKFIVTPKGTKVRFKTESNGVRGLMQTNTFTANENTEFCFADLSKFFKSVSLIHKMEKKDEAELEYDNTFIRYKSNVTFKLKTVIEERVDRFTYPQDMKVEFVNQYSFNTTTDDIKKALKCVNIIDDTDAKVYFSKSKDSLICEIDNKKNQISDSVGIPLCKEGDIQGEVAEVVATTLDIFRTFAVLPSKTINISMTKQKVIVVTSKYVNDNNYIVMKLCCSILK